MPYQWARAFHPDDREKMSKFLGDVLTGGKAEAEVRVLTKEGKVRWLHVYGQPKGEGNDHRRSEFIIAAKDITERKEAEKALLRSERKYRDLFESSKDGIIMTDIKGNILDANKAYLDMLGYEKDEILKLTIQQLTPEKWHEMEKEIIENQLLTRGYSDEYEKEYIRKDGTIFPISIKVWLVKDDHGQPIGEWGFIRDITERKRVEEKSVRLEAQLHQASKMEALGTLAGGIAHDFNNILGAIIGNAELMEMFDLPEDSPLCNNLDEIIWAGYRAKELIGRILAFSRQKELKREPMQLGPIVQEALNLLRATLPTTIEIRQHIEKENGNVLTDPSQIHQVLINLCTNAADAMRKKGGLLKVELTEVELDAQAADRFLDLEPGPYVRLLVSDTGRGMKREVMGRIFDPYFSTKKERGTGLGLPVVHGIVKGLGGAIEVRSEEGKGSVFELLFPSQKEEAFELQTEKLGPVPRGNECILFVDDEKTLVDTGKGILEYLGYEVITRTNGIEALEAFRAHPDRFDLVITDMTMPSMTGVELTKEIMKIQPDIPIILCTGYSEMISEDRAKVIGIREFLLKPLGVRDLAEIVRKALGD